MKKHFLILTCTLLLQTIYIKSFSQDFMMQGWYWDYPKTANGYNWADTLQAKATSIAKGGFTYVWLPPFMRSSSGSLSNGYDPYDLYDLGGYGLGPTGFGSASDLTNLVNIFNNNNIKAIADVIYNHRNGGIAENNPVVQDYVNNAHSSVCSTNPLYNDPSYNPYPSDRFRYILPLGGTTGNGAGDYYIKISSVSGSSNYYGFPYTFYVQTNKVGYQNQPAIAQIRPDGGGDCGQADMTAPLGVNINATIANPSDASANGCRTDEYHITLTSSSFNPNGDTLFIYLSNQNGQYSDHRIYGLWSGALNQDIANQLVVQTYTDFTHVASGQGQMNYSYFHPNGTNCSVLGKDWDYPSFFYDYDQSAGTNTESALINWTKWLWNNVGIRGLRMDDVKAFNPQFVGDLMNSLNSSNINPGFVVGEYFDYTVSNVNNWISTTKSYMNTGATSSINVRAFDFPMRQALKNALDVYGTDVRTVYSAGIAHNGGSGYNAVTFINNHDLRDAGQPIQNNPLLAYAYIFTDNSIGMPSVFYPDYFGVSVPNYPTVYLKPTIDSLISLYKTYINGSPTIEYLNYEGSSYLNSPTNYISAANGASKTTTLIYQISGGPSQKDIIVAINFSGTELQVDHQIDTHNGAIVSGTRFYDRMNHSKYPYAVVGSDNTIYIDLPAFSFSVWTNDNAVPLPINITSFTGSNSNGSAVLKWNTSQEADNKAFIIQKSTDGNSFDSLSVVIPANSSSTLAQNYQFTDNNLNQDSYYKLKQVATDGTIAYSNVVGIQANMNANTFIVLNNGKQAQLAAKGNYNPAIPLSVAIVNTDGQILLNATKTLNDINEDMRTKLSNIPSGVYFIKVLYNNKTTTLKFIR